jgi:hypothetical protein
MTSRARRTNADKRLAIIPAGELIRTTLNAMQVTTDQKVGGSSPSERAPYPQVRAMTVQSPLDRLCRLAGFGRISGPGDTVEPVGVAVPVAGVEVTVQVEGRGDAGVPHDLLEHLRRVSRLDHQ